MLETINYHEGHDLVPTPSRGGTNVLNVASAKGLDFDIEMQPTGYFSPTSGNGRFEQGEFIIPRYANGERRGEPRGQYILRESTSADKFAASHINRDGKIMLGHVSGRYPSRDGYKHVFQTLEDLFPNTCTDITSFGLGERIVIQQELGEAQQLLENDMIQPYVYTQASLNGKWATRINPIDFRLSCLNQLKVANLLISCKATLNHDQMLTARSKLLDMSRIQAAELQVMAQAFDAQAFTDAQFHRMVDVLAPVAKDDAHAKTTNSIAAKRGALNVAWLKEKQHYNSNGNAWLAWNAFQGAEQHKVNQGFKADAKAQGRSLAMTLEAKTPIADAAESYLRELVLL